MANPNIFNKAVGLLKIGAISTKGYNLPQGIVYVQLNDAGIASGNSPIKVQLPLSLYSNSGMFIGALPEPGTPVIVAQGTGGEYHFVSWIVQEPSKLPSIRPGQLLIQGNEHTQFKIDVGNTNIPKNDIFIGSANDRLHLNSVSSYSSSNFNNAYSFTQASMNINGVVKRDIKRNTLFSQSSKLDQDIYEDLFQVIGFDPTVPVNTYAVGPNKNPAFTEKRELIYEFEHSSNVSNDLNESEIYESKSKDNNSDIINRRLSKSDTLSLTLAEPNYLMETVKGTVIDIFGNILDLNRAPLPIGKGQTTLSSEKSEDKIKSFFKIKELERKSLAYHFEINARKKLVDGIVLPDINSNTDNSKNRSRFFIDIDKEGQFKINVPASSDNGNIPLLARYENYSSFSEKSPNELMYRDDNIDIRQDSFAAAPLGRYKSKGISWSDRGSITIKDGYAIATPIDRITEKNIMHGTAHHDILTTCHAMTVQNFISCQNDPAGPNRNIDVDAITAANSHLENICSSTINVSGENANAGGRSGSINLDGSIEVNVGANTIDRQSLWLDLAGGIVANVGRDNKNKSLAMNMDGDIYLQVGGTTVTSDSRFVGQENGLVEAVVDIRVLTKGIYATMIRIDKNGVSILTPSNIQLHANKDIKITADASISLEAEHIYLNKRMVLKEGDSI